MKKLLIIIAVLFLAGCGVPLQEDGQFGREQFVGKFRDINIYAVETPGGNVLYIGVHEDGTTTTTVTQPYTVRQGNTQVTKYRTVIIDGKEYIEKDDK